MLRRPRPLGLGTPSAAVSVPSVECRLAAAFEALALVEGPGLDPERPMLLSWGRRVGEEGADKESTGRSAPWKGPASGASNGVVGTETEVPRAPKGGGCIAPVLLPWIVESEVSICSLCIEF